MPKSVWLVAVLCLALARSAPGEHAGEEERGSRAWDVSRCEFMKRRPDLPFLKDEWALDASGAYFLRNHPAVITAKAFDEQALGIIDSGLLLRGNPDAGARLAESSPETEYDKHGTHVAGIAASKAHGVNPSLRIKSFPVVYVDSQDPNNTFRPGGFDNAGLLEAVKRAGKKDSGVSVLNLSISAGEDEAMRLAIQEAMDNGKWVVRSSGNNAELNSSSSAGLRAFYDDPRLFAVGAMSYYGAPSSYSNFGPQVKFYAPGSDVESLAAGYNPNLVHPTTEASYSGTSMASPHFAAVLTTLRAIAPSLDIRDARKILEMTALQRGQKPPLFQVNGFHAVELLSRSLARKEKSGGSLASHLDDAEKEIRDEALKDSKKVSPPAEEKCEAWEAYLDGLKQGYFLSNGTLFGSDIAHALSGTNKPLAERVYFSSASGRAEAFSEFGTPKGRNVEAEHERADKFFKGNLQVVGEGNEQDDLRKDNPDLYLSLLPAHPDNVDRYIKVCSWYLNTGKKYPRSCPNYLSDAPRAFLVALGKKLAGKDKVASPKLAFLIRRHSTGPEDDTLFKELFGQAARNWWPNCDLEELWSMEANMDALSFKDRATLLANFLKVRKSNNFLVDSYDRERMLKPETLDRLQARLESWGDEKAIEGKVELLQKQLGQEKADPSVGRLRYFVRRLEAGFGQPEQIANALRDMLAIAKSDQKESVQEYGDSAYNSFALGKAIADPAAAEAIASVLLEEGNVAAWLKVSRPDLLAKLPAALKEPKATQLIDAFYKELRGAQHYGDNILYYALKTNEAHPKAKEYIAELARGPQTDPGLQKARIQHLKLAVRQATSFSPEVKAWLAEAPEDYGPLFYIPLKAVASSPELRAKYREAMDAASPDGYGGDRFLERTRVDGKTFSVLAEDLVPRVAKLWRNSKEFSVHDAEEVASAFVTFEGANAPMMNQLFGQLGELVADEAFLKTLVRPDSKYSESHLSTVSTFVQVLNLGKGGHRWLEEHPDFSKNLANAIVKSTARDPLRFDLTIPQPMIEPLRAGLPPAMEDIKLPEWVAPLLSQDPKSIDRAFEYLEKGDEEAKNEVRNSLRVLAMNHPELAKEIRGRTKDPKLLKEIEEESP